MKLLNYIFRFFFRPKNEAKTPVSFSDGKINKSPSHRHIDTEPDGMIEDLEIKIECLQSTLKKHEDHLGVLEQASRAHERRLTSHIDDRSW